MGASLRGVSCSLDLFSLLLLDFLTSFPPRLILSAWKTHFFVFKSAFSSPSRYFCLVGTPLLNLSDQVVTQFAVIAVP